MIQITPQMRLLLAVEPVDFRKGSDGLAQVCRQKLNTDPIVVAFRAVSVNFFQLISWQNGKRWRAVTG